MKSDCLKIFTHQPRQFGGLTVSKTALRVQGPFCGESSPIYVVTENLKSFYGTDRRALWTDNQTRLYAVFELHRITLLKPSFRYCLFCFVVMFFGEGELVTVSRSPPGPEISRESSVVGLGASPLLTCQFDVGLIT
ncbi:hypothetical protein PoB_001710400 [Plakobranchus ocellatus]|uniref:Sema domain-containing protein n=1 Tax=Plakobranchus ocellatus TaxID=259542 RepID=A0AAV3Z5L5_9GAST|nr:hypothetical protein PoB_001710400 [Plakobranchus ocellatus]